MPSPKRTPSSTPAQSWTFLTNHAHVLLCIARDPEARIRDIAARVGITERAVQRILSELEEAGYVAHDREGRRNRYEVRDHLPLRHDIERHRNVASLIALVRATDAEHAARPAATKAKEPVVQAAASARPATKKRAGRA